MIAQRLPLTSLFAEFPKAGGLIAYGPNVADINRRAGDYVGKILHGAKPNDLPIQRPEKFELVINLKTAEALGLAARFEAVQVRPERPTSFWVSRLVRTFSSSSTFFSAGRARMTAARYARRYVRLPLLEQFDNLQKKRPRTLFLQNVPGGLSFLVWQSPARRGQDSAAHRPPRARPLPPRICARILTWTRPTPHIVLPLCCGVSQFQIWACPGAQTVRRASVPPLQA